ncbi:MAG TPA: transcription elongation factor GreA [Nitrospiraceae bacterium]|nr:transcription elongation factor GreA [Nitrospiraceae bacterium]
MKKIPMTPEGYQRLQEDLEKLLKIERPQNIRDIAEARAHGDLSENAEYHAAREQQSFIEGRIRGLQTKLALAHVIDPSRINQDKIAFGAKVRLMDTMSGEEKVFTLVGTDESDVRSGKISISSPVGKSLIAKAVGDVVTIKAPAKTLEYEILEISFE